MRYLPITVEAVGDLWTLEHMLTALVRGTCTVNSGSLNSINLSRFLWLH
jgi:hypothetical protein